MIKTQLKSDETVKSNAKESDGDFTYAITGSIQPSRYCNPENQKIGLFRKLSIRLLLKIR